MTAKIKDQKRQNFIKIMGNIEIIKSQNDSDYNLLEVYSIPSRRSLMKLFNRTGPSIDL